MRNSHKFVGVEYYEYCEFENDNSVNLRRNNNFKKNNTKDKNQS